MVPPGHRHSIFTPACLTTFAQRASSLFSSASNCAGVPPAAVRPSAARIFSTSADFRASFDSLLIRSMASFGVPLGPTRPCQLITWHGLVGPKGTPKEAIDRINRESNEALKSADVEKILAADGLTAAGGTPAQFEALLKSELARWAKVVKQAGVKIE